MYEFVRRVIIKIENFTANCWYFIQYLARWAIAPDKPSESTLYNKTHRYFLHLEKLTIETLLLIGQKKKSMLGRIQVHKGYIVC